MSWPTSTLSCDVRRPGRYRWRQGLEWFVRMPVNIDYARSRITLYDPAQFKYAEAARGCRWPKRGRLPQVRGTIDGIEGMLELDTGSRGSLTLTPAFVDEERSRGATRAKERGDHRRRYGRSRAGLSSPVAKMLKLGARRADCHRRVAPGQAIGADGHRGQRRLRGLRQFALTFDLPGDALTSIAMSGSARRICRPRRALDRAQRRRLHGGRRGSRRTGSRGGT